MINDRYQLQQIWYTMYVVQVGGQLSGQKGYTSISHHFAAMHRTHSNVPETPYGPWCSAHVAWIIEAANLIILCCAEPRMDFRPRLCWMYCSLDHQMTQELVWLRKGEIVRQKLQGYSRSSKLEAVHVVYTRRHLLRVTEAWYLQ